MRTFLTAAKASGTVPDVICWHELSGWQRVAGDIAAYRALEKELGISARPISIDEYATTAEIDVPAQANHYVAAFERGGVRDAERAFWYEPGTLNGLLHNGSPTASYWMYKWYADQSGSVVKVTPTSAQDGVASYDPGSKRFSVVFGGESGNNTVRVTGLSALGANAKVVVTSVPGSGRTTNVVRTDDRVLPDRRGDQRDRVRHGQRAERVRCLQPRDHTSLTTREAPGPRPGPGASRRSATNWPVLAEGYVDCARPVEPPGQSTTLDGGQSVVHLDN